MKLIGVIRPNETKTIEVEADDYEDGRAQLYEAVPEGWDLLNIRKAD